MGQRHSPRQIVFRFDHGWFNANFAQGVLQQPVEIGGDDNADEPILDQLGDGAMGLGRHLAVLGNVLLRRFNIAMQNGATFIRGRGKVVQEFRVLRLVAEFRSIPFRPVGLVSYTSKNGGSLHQVQRDFPTGRESGSAGKTGAKQQRVNALILKQ